MIKYCLIGLSAVAIHLRGDDKVSIYDKKQDEPIFMALKGASPEMVDARAQAKQTLPAFRQAIIDRKYPGAFFNVKGYFPEADGSEGPHLWLWVRELNDDGLVCVPFELPKDFTGLKPDQKVLMKDADIEDWMINHDGILYGGFSLRVQRSHVPETEREAFDRFIGVKEYKTEKP